MGCKFLRQEVSEGCRRSLSILFLLPSQFLSCHRQKSGPSKFESVKLMKICDVINFVIIMSYASEARIKFKK